MPFPQGGDFVRDVSQGFHIVTSDPELDDSSGFVSSSPNIDSLVFIAQLLREISSDQFIEQVENFVTGIFYEYNFSIEHEGSTFIAKLSNEVASSVFVVLRSFFTSSFWRMAQFNPGVLPHWNNTFSDLYVYDVFSGYNVYNRLALYFLDSLAPKIRQTGAFNSFGNLVSTDYYSTIEDGADICVGDETPPFITYIEPTISGAHLRPRDQIVEFSLTDAVAGVDISTIYVSLNSQTTSGTISLVVAGADQTGGDVAIIGDASSYLIRYTPPFMWDPNDVVLVTISGADLPPEVGGNPFFCGDSNVNIFSGDIPFKIRNDFDLGAIVDVIGDVEPPYLYSSTPVSGTLNNNVFTPVIINLADDLTGVNLSSVVITIDGKVIVNNGVPTTEETSVVGIPSLYQFTYIPVIAFVYGSTSTVTIFAEDRVTISPVNEALITYDFSFIDDSTLVIENFLPAPGTYSNLDSLDIEVDVRDDTYGVDIDQTFFVINGVIVSGTQTPLASGIHLSYHPPNDFDYGEPVRVTVHGTNDNFLAPAIKESFFTLYYGYRILFDNEDPYLHQDTVDVYVRARNTKYFHKDLSSGYFFSTYTQPSDNISASIEAINPVSNLLASINVIAPEHRYGKEVTVTFSVEDLEGNVLGPYTFTYTIEESSD